MRYFVLLLFITIIMFNCSDNGEKIGDVKVMDQSVKNDLQILEKARIYFGHQSVGFNLMDGVADLMKEAGDEKLHIIELSSQANLPEYYFSHGRVGKNTEPITKCDAFAGVLNKEFADSLDIAYLKFCYVDMRENDNPHELFEYYKKTIDSIKLKHPNLMIMHVTLPLTKVQSGWKVPLKKILGKEIDGYKDNIKRAEYNALLKNYYKDEPIFDLSTVESTYPDGSRESFEVDGKTYYALIPEYTYDGGHLNELGRQLAAKGMLHVLADIMRDKGK